MSEAERDLENSEYRKSLDSLKSIRNVGWGSRTTTFHKQADGSWFSAETGERRTAEEMRRGEGTWHRVHVQKEEAGL